MIITTTTTTSTFVFYIFQGMTHTQFVCDNYFKVFTRNSNLKCHKKVQHEHKCISCIYPGCTFTTTTKYLMQQHIMVQHLKIKIFICGCGQCFGYCTSLTHHCHHCELEEPPRTEPLPSIMQIDPRFGQDNNSSDNADDEAE